MLCSAGIVLAYTFLGGLTSAIYNEVLQFFLIVIGFSPLAILAVWKAGGWSGMASHVPPVMTHSWRYMGSPADNPMGIEAFGLIAGLGSCFPSVTGVRIFWWCSAPWLPIRCPRPSGPRYWPRCRK